MVGLRITQGTAIGIVASVASVAEFFGNPPAILLLVAGYAWLRLLGARRGAGLALSIAVVGWATVTFVAMSSAPVLPGGTWFAVGLAHLAMTCPGEGINVEVPPALAND